MQNQSILKKSSLFTVLSVLFLNYVGVGLVFPLFPQLCFDPSLGFLSEQATALERSVILGILLATMPLTQFFFVPLLGAHSDVVGRKPLLIKSLVMGVIGYCLGALSIVQSSLSLLLLSRVLVGISTSNSSVVAAALADMSAKNERAPSFALYGMSVGCGMVVGPLLGAMLSQKGLSWTSYSLPFFAAGLMTLTNLFSTLFFFPKYAQKVKEEKDYLSPLTLIKRSFSDPDRRIYFLMAFTFYFGWTFFWEFIPVTVMHTMGYKSEEVGTIYSTGAIAYLILSLLATKQLISKMPIQQLLPLSLGALSLLVAALTLVTSTETLFCFIIFQQFFISCIYPLFSTYISENSLDTEQGVSLGMLLATKAAACSLGPLFSGFLFCLSPFSPIIIGFSCLALSCCLALYFFSFRKAHPQD